VRNYYQNECEILLVTGLPEGCGKSAYCNLGLADSMGFIKCHDKEQTKYMYQENCNHTTDNPLWECDYEAAKPMILYKPEDVVSYLMTLLIKKEKVPMVIWDDAGSWLHSMSFSDAFVVSFMQFLPLARSVTGLVVLSTPVEEWVLKKLATAGGIIHAPVIKQASNDDHVWRPRICKAYRKARSPMSTRYYPQYQWEDHFTAIMPDNFYSWYKPKRDFYCQIAVGQMWMSLKKKREAGLNVTMDENILAEIEASMSNTENKVREFKEVIAQNTIP
jgi:hypothetical protein